MNVKRINSVLREIERRVSSGGYFPIIGPVKGELLYVFTLLAQPLRVLELGTGIGYSGLQIARALKPGARIVTVDEDKENADEAQANFRRAGVEELVTVIVDEAGRHLQIDNSLYDMIFMDIEKSRYLDLLEDCISRLRPNGILVADNVLWPELRRFRQTIMTHPQLTSSIIRIEDGVSLSVKKA
ncbi:Putative O-methyltransferase [Candidatus Calditenuaceae archaeon HR02]|nr:Putative O-methyltransferase [Candidatus Calditenuaceae archaeon HR02]